MVATSAQAKKTAWAFLQNSSNVTGLWTDCFVYASGYHDAEIGAETSTWDANGNGVCDVNDYVGQTQYVPSNWQCEASVTASTMLYSLDSPHVLVYGQSSRVSWGTEASTSASIYASQTPPNGCQWLTFTAWGEGVTQ